MYTPPRYCIAGRNTGPKAKAGMVTTETLSDAMDVCKAYEFTNTAVYDTHNNTWVCSYADPKDKDFREYKQTIVNVYRDSEVGGV
jgi:hypothetical protein